MWCEATDIEKRLGVRYNDALPPDDDGSFAVEIIVQAAAYIAGRLAPRYSLDASSDPSDPVLKALCADEAAYRLLVYRDAGDVAQGESVLHALKQSVEAQLNLIAKGQLKLSTAQQTRTLSELATADQFIIKPPQGW